MSKDFKFTQGQSQAIGERGSSILVSAAAGSGKTRVLVQRLMERICNEGKDIDRFLIITYTNAAAAELKGRILKELNKRCSENPGDKRLRRQSSLCSRARISTIHKFCFSLLRERGQDIGISPDFALLDEERGAELRERCLDNILEDAYESIGENAGFRLLVDMAGAGRDDSRLAQIILELHGKMLSHPYPKKWAEAQIAACYPGDAQDLSHTIWGKELMDNARTTAQYWEKRLSDMMADLEFEGEGGAVILEKYSPSLRETQGGLKAFIDALDESWDKAFEASVIPFPRLSVIRNCPDPELQEKVKAIRELCKKACEGFSKDFSGYSKELIADLNLTAPAIESLLKLTMALYDDFRREKLRRNVLDFSDAEHYALELLIDPETGNPTETAVSVQSRFEEIMVDEYQDVNNVQEMIFTAISKDGNNLFMVGDVKQSIYSFRLANPGIFLDKLSRFPDCDKASNGQSRRVLLRENFRSRPCVLEAANHVFSNIMSPELGDLRYDDTARLIPGATFSEDGEAPVDIDILDIPPNDPNGERADTRLLEARHVAARIKAIHSRMLVGKEGERRPLEYGDIAILVRSPDKFSRAFKLAFEELSIPFESQQSGGFFESLEIQVIISLLRIIDNPRQDIPLISVLSSPLFGFSPDELAEIRIAGRDVEFYDALSLQKEGSEKISRFLSILGELREDSRDGQITSILWSIYESTDFLSIVSAMDGGDLRRENLMKLFEYAANFEQSGYMGIFRFVRYLDRLAAGKEAVTGGSIGVSGGSVRLMSIHKSKGLEFPVVFLSGMAGRFYRQDVFGRLLSHAKMGLGAKVTDADRGIEYPTIAHKAVARRITIEKLSEEMRVLYVAMTRPMEKLFITAAVKNPDGFLAKLKISAESPLSPKVLEGGSSFIHWIAQTSMCPGGQEHFNLQIIDGMSVAEEVPVPDDFIPEASPEIIPEKLEKLSARLSYIYLHSQAVSLPSKLTATEMKGRAVDEGLNEEAATQIKDYFPLEPRRANFSAAPKKLSPAEKGTALHLAMQHLDYAKTETLGQLRDEISRLLSANFLTKEQADAVDIHAIHSFFSTDLGIRLRESNNLLREFKFSILSRADEFFQYEGDDEVLLQGVVDCCIVEDDGIVVLDFKTDYVTEETVSERAALYENQVRIYARSLERILKKPVKKGVLYFFRIQAPVEIAVFD